MRPGAECVITSKFNPTYSRRETLILASQQQKACQVFHSSSTRKYANSIIASSRRVLSPFRSSCFAMSNPPQCSPNLPPSTDPQFLPFPTLLHTCECQWQLKGPPIIQKILCQGLCCNAVWSILSLFFHAFPARQVLACRLDPRCAMQ